MIHYYIGDGKGKTTAAFGLMLRCVGQGGKAAAIQFLKSGESGEVSAIKKIHGADYFNCESKHDFYHQLSQDKQETVRDEILAEVKLASEIIRDQKYDLLVLDEICDAVELGIIPLEAVMSILQEAGRTEIVLTGHRPLQQIEEIADYYTSFICKKHPYKNGTKPRKGIEF